MSGIYLVSVKVTQGNTAGLDLPAFINKISGLLCGYSKATTVIHKFKVTGEARVLALFDVKSVIGLERTLAGLYRMALLEVSCHPVLPYETFAKTLGVDASLTKPSQNEIKEKQLFWLDFQVEYPGKSTEKLLEIWQREATAALSARVKDGMQIDIFKVVAERKVHVFISCSPEAMDGLSMNLPLMKENGENVTINCRGIQLLDDYTSSINLKPGMRK